MIAKAEKETITKVLSHLLAWSVLFAFPLLISVSEQDIPADFYIRIWSPMILMLGIFYLNYFILIERYLLENKLTYYVFINILLAITCLIVNEYLVDLFRLPNQFPPPNQVPFDRHRQLPFGRGAFKLKTFLFFIFSAGTSAAIKATQKWMEAETMRKNMENENLKSALTHLRYQIQPHFFFNSLNNIYSLIDSSPDKAKEIILGLSKLMRHVLYETKDEKITLTKEIEFLNSFIKLMEIRLMKNVVVNVSFPIVYAERNIAPLLFVPLVENAFKHGISISRQTEIYIRMEVDENKIVFTTQNTYSPKTNEDSSLSGIGLQNLKSRLELLYPNCFELENSIEGEFYLSQLVIHYE